MLQPGFLALQFCQPVALPGNSAVGPVDVAVDPRLLQLRFPQLALERVAALVGAADLAVDAGDIGLQPGQLGACLFLVGLGPARE
ncbi:hypothetical protein DWB85_02995 [Seongchinamella sediminis]|uniref:Uncharacterized protein n=1 Tax=Seongchinamella sediminis TaxID=2283635 RepID=A0A3L7E222_9GAMM|nr:hypothetical protein [Seongchinamella sediminis]RLQ23534.1 hypothetical protein DWB85_02995 [Seongchinamella sediminis]